MGKDLTIVNNIIFICNGGSCLKKGAEENTNILRECIKENNLHERIHTIKTRCCGQCENGPIVFMHPDDIWYKEIDHILSKSIITQHIVANQPLENNILYLNSSTPESKGLEAERQE